MKEPPQAERVVRPVEILASDGGVLRPERRRTCGPLRPYGPRHPAERRRGWRPAGEPGRGRRLDLSL